MCSARHVGDVDDDDASAGSAERWHGDYASLQLWLSLSVVDNNGSATFSHVIAYRCTCIQNYEQSSCILTYLHIYMNVIYKTFVI